MLDYARDFRDVADGLADLERAGLDQVGTTAAPQATSRSI
jgi:hypothetical protein